MEIVKVSLADRSYDIAIGDRSLDHVGEIARASLSTKARRLVVVSNPQINALYGRPVKRALRGAGFGVLTHLIPDGERAKSVKTAEGLWAFLIDHRLERSDALVALGGGVVGDLTGFAAASYLRGIDYIQIPTSLLAQIDSSVGGKTAINHRLGKNLIGAFHQPRAVAIDPKVLDTLPPRELQAGRYEMLKYGVIRDAGLFEQTVLQKGDLGGLIARCCQIKADVVGYDEREVGLRQILNFGHTVGHALEAVTQYRRLKHGEAVGYGMKCAAMISERVGLTQRSVTEAIARGVDGLGKLPKISDLDVRHVLSAMAHDKKVTGGRLTFVLPERIGSVVIRNDVPEAAVRDSVRALIRGGVA
jgi:3-dehydroquinate synthase